MIKISLTIALDQIMIFSFLYVFFILNGSALLSSAVQEASTKAGLQFHAD